MAERDPQRLEYATTPPGRGKNRLRLLWISLGITLAGLILVTSIILPLINRLRAGGSQSQCAMNLHQIGLAILLYQNDDGGAYPDTLDKLLGECISPRCFVCPDSTDAPASGATTQAIVADFRKPGHLSYIYTGGGLTNKTDSPFTVVLYEPLSNHGNGMYVLFGDGHVEWMDANVGSKIVAAAATGQCVTIDGGKVTTSPIPSTQTTAK